MRRNEKIKMATQSKEKQGFALVDLLLLVAILAVISVIIFFALGGVRQRARDAARKRDLIDIRSALMAYYNANEHTFPGTTKANVAEEVAVSTNQVYEKLVPTHLKKIPSTQIATPEYAYNYITNNPTDGAVGTNFALLAHLELPDQSKVFVVNYDGFQGTVSRGHPETTYLGYSCGQAAGKNVCIKDVP